MQKIPLALVTGFLGSGKTTFLQHLAGRYTGQRVAFLVNEFSQVDVDGPLLKDGPLETISLPGGSIFCRCLVGEFLARLTEIADRLHDASAPLAGLVVEASGIADPRVVRQMLAETHLDERYDLSHVVAVVDPGTFRKLLATLPNIRSQVEAADTILLNKTDLFDEDQLAATEADLRAIRTDATILRSQFCRVEVDLLGAPAPPADAHGDYAPCADPNYGKLRMDFDQPVSRKLLEEVLTAAGGDLYRAKGFVPTDDGLLYVDVAAGQVHLRPVSNGSAAHSLAVIAPGNRTADVRRILATLLA